MKTRLILSSLVLSLSLSAADPTTWLNREVPQLVLASGKTYTKVKFTKIEPDAITILHAGGLARIRMEDLTEEARTALGYDPEKAAEARKQSEANAAAAAATNANRVAMETGEEVIAARAAVEREADAKAERRYFRVTVSAILPGEGILCDNVRDKNFSPFLHVGGEHLVKMDPSAYELYDGRDISIVAISGGVVTTEDGRTLKVWKLVPGQEVTLHN